MTTTEQLREYLDAHGIDGPPAEPGWYVVRTISEVMVVTVWNDGRHTFYAVGSEHNGRYLFRSDITRHATLTLAPPSGRDLDALRAIIESGAGVAKEAADLLAKVLRGDYQWPNGVAWAVRETHRILTGGPPDGVYVRAKDDAGRGTGAEGTPRV